MSGTNWEGYLTPDQLQALYTAGDAYTSGLARFGPQGPVQTSAQANYALATQAAQYAHDVSRRDSAESLAARGMLQSGIGATDFADLDRSLSIRQSAAQSTLNNILLNAQGAIDDLTRAWGHAQTVGQGEAAIGAAAAPQFQPYQVTSPAPTGAPGPGAPPTLRKGQAFSPTVSRRTPGILPRPRIPVR